MPDAVAAVASEPGALLVAEGVSVKASGSLRFPGRRSSGFVKMHSGALVILPGRLLASVGRHLLVDEWPDSLSSEPSTMVRLDTTGLHLAVDLAKAIPGGTGHLEIEFRHPLPRHVLGSLPVSEWSGTLACPDPTVALRHI